jgi:hypothetical protein
MVFDWAGMGKDGHSKKRVAVVAKGLELGPDNAMMEVLWDEVGYWYEKCYQPRIRREVP